MILHNLVWKIGPVQYIQEYPLGYCLDFFNCVSTVLCQLFFCVSYLKLNSLMKTVTLHKIYLWIPWTNFFLSILLLYSVGIYRILLLINRQYCSILLANNNTRNHWFCYLQWKTFQTFIVGSSFPPFSPNPSLLTWSN